MKYFTIVAVALLFFVSVASAHEFPTGVDENGIVRETPYKQQQASEAADLIFHLFVFGGLGVAGLNGLWQNKKATGKYLAWYRG
jgi:hypothetical protein